MLESVIRPIYTATQRAIALLSAPRWQPNPALDALSEQEAREFQRFMEARDEGHYLPYRDSPKAGAIKMMARERSVANVEAGMLRHDRAAREKGVVNGDILRVQLVEIQQEHPAPRIFHYRLIMSSHQDSLHLRVGDVLCTMDGPKVSARIDEVERRGPFTWVTAMVVEGKNAVKRMSSGVSLDFGPEAPQWQRIGSELSQMSNRLVNPPWTHGDTVPVAVPVPGSMPADLLATVERLA